MKEDEKEELGCGCDCSSCGGCGSHEAENEDGILTFLDEEGKEVRFDILDVVSMDEKEYLVVMPISGIEIDEDDGDVLILEIKQENGEEVYDTVQDEEIAQKVFEKFQEEYGDDDTEDYDDEDETGCDCDDCDCHECGTDGCD